MSRSDGSTADYYVLPEGATQLQDLISHRDMNYYIGSIFDLCYDYSKSGSCSLEIAKEMHELASREVERLQKVPVAEADQ
jgi:hypothetical protein